MDEVMDTSDTVDVADDDNLVSESGFEQNSSMDISPIFERRGNLRTHRRAVSSSRWLNLSEDDGSSNSHMSEENVGPRHEPTHPVSDLSPPPIEDTDLIMIHRPASSNQDNEEASGVRELPLLSEETNDQNMYTANEMSNPQPLTSSGDNLRESVMLDQEREAEGDIIQDDHNDSVEIVMLESEEQIPPVPPDVENMPLAQRIRSPDLQPPERSPPPKKIKFEVKIEPEIKNNDDIYEDEEGKLCPICFDSWTNSGEHRLVSLRCGHLFGKHCIEHWLQIHKTTDKKCPQCKKKATAKDIRPLYASKIRVLDTSEQEALKETIKKLEEEKESLSRELAYERQLHQDALKIQLQQQEKLLQLQNQGILSETFRQSLPATSKQVAAIAAQIKISQTARIEVSRDGGCRVLAFNEWKGVLVASQSQFTPLFPDFGIRLIDSEEFRLRQIIPMHSKAIRDLSFNPHRKDLLLSASLDKTCKMFCMSSNASVMTFNAEVPLWTCCWDGNNSNIFFAGSQNGITFQYDIRNTHSEVSRITTQGDGTPVISLAAIPAGTWLANGGFLSCRLSRLRVYERTSNSEFRAHPLSIVGPFSALNYDHKSQHMLVSTKPTIQNPHAQHQLYEMATAATQPQANIVHSFVGGTTQRVLSRPCQLDFDDGKVKDSLICAHQESEGHVAIWSVTSGQKIPGGPLLCSEPIMDLCPVKMNNRTFLASLSDKALRVYQLST